MSNFLWFHLWMVIAGGVLLSPTLLVPRWRHGLVASWRVDPVLATLYALFACDATGVGLLCVFVLIALWS